MKGSSTVHYTTVQSPIGVLLVIGDEDGLNALYLSSGRHSVQTPNGARRDDAALADVRAQLEEYFAGKRMEFDLRLNPLGTPFQLKVWQALRAIPYGTTASYGQQARAVGDPGSARAVGLANGRNPISIIVPCHRVIGADGSLTGYGGGIEAKRWLLDHEAKHAGLTLL
jgi:methylated-DNA-[protein]-cysteine S-methyltransferase